MKYTPLFERKSIAFMILGLVAFILYLYFFVGFAGLFSLLSKLNVYQYSLFFSLAIVSVFLAVVFDSMIWHSLLGSLSVKVKLRKIVLFNWIGNFVELVIPSVTIGGELTRIVLVQKETKHDLGIAAGTVIGSRLITTFVYSGGLLISFLLLLFYNQLPFYMITPVLLVAVGTAAALAVVFIIAFKESAGKKIINFSLWVARHITKNPVTLSHAEAKISQSISSFSEVFRTFRSNPLCLIKPIIFSIIAWLFNIIVFLMVFYSLNFTRISFIDLATIYSVITTVETVTAGFPIGAVEVAMTSLFGLYGVPLVIAAAATTLTRLLTYWCQVLVGYPLVEWIGLKSLLKSNITTGLMMKAPPILREE
jgi:uncharacterized protein (TIRG00374 family)